VALNINFYQIQNVTIESTSENFKKIIDNIISIGIPQLSCSVGEIDLSIITYKYPDKLNLSGSISMNIYENNDFSIYEKLKTIIDSGEEFDLTITINVIGIDESNTFK